MNDNQSSDPLVNFLLRLDQKEDSGVFAALRSGVGKTPGDAPRMLRHIAPYLRSNDPNSASVASDFLTASLFAMNPQHEPRASLGVALHRSTRSDANPNGKHGMPGMEARFTAMLDAHEDDLPRHLTALMSLCESAGQGLDWYKFHMDVYALLSGDEDRGQRTRFNLARDFWRGDRTREATQNTSGEEI